MQIFEWTLRKMAFQTLRDVGDVVLRRMDAEQLTKELRSTAPFLIPFLKMTCVYFILWLDQGSFPAAIVKCLPLLSLIWFVCLLGISDKHAHRYNRRVVAALTCCCAGDFFLVWAESGDVFFLLGLGCFAVGHVVYSFAFGWTPFGVKEFVLSFSVGIVITAGIASCVNGPLKYATIGYGVLLITMEWRALARFHLSGDIPWRKICAACGATLFVVSDTVLAINKFCSPIAEERYIVMVTYYAAQLCIALSVVNSYVIHSSGPGMVAGGDQKNKTFHLNGTRVDNNVSDAGDGIHSITSDVMHNKNVSEFH